MIKETISQIKSDLTKAEDKLNNTNDFTKEVNDRAREVKNEALELLNEVQNLFVPVVDVPELSNKSNELKDEARRLTKEYANLVNKSNAQMERIDNITEKGRDLLEKGFDQQQILTELVDDIHAANDSVVKTIDEWTEKLQETERIYEDLKSTPQLAKTGRGLTVLLADSDSDTQKLRKNAEDALKTIPEIEAIINEALKEAVDEEAVLEAISETAAAALNTAEDAKDETERVSIGVRKMSNLMQEEFTYS